MSVDIETSVIRCLTRAMDELSNAYTRCLDGLVADDIQNTRDDVRKIIKRLVTLHGEDAPRMTSNEEWEEILDND
jgi:hypothetical protein